MDVVLSTSPLVMFCIATEIKRIQVSAAMTLGFKLCLCE